VGYKTGAGGTVTQLTNKSTGVTLNTPCGSVVMNNAALAANALVNFLLTNSAIAATDTIAYSFGANTTGGAYSVSFFPSTGSTQVYVRNVSAGSLSESVVIYFSVIKSVIA
ncbi:MAG: hypothetical protein WCE58_02240, partial [Gallionella sp.]